MLLLTQLLAVLALVFAVGVMVLRWRATQRRLLSPDRAPAKGSPQRGAWYAFTLGMAPWAKESTRRHWVAYLRGIGFHVGIFAGLAALVGSPLWPLIPAPLLTVLAVVTGAGALLGFAGEVLRWVEPNLRALSTPDDHASVLVVSLFLTTISLALLNTAWLPAMYMTSAVMLVYAPLGKIRHCLYFFFSRRFYGLFIGRRAILHPEVTR